MRLRLILPLVLGAFAAFLGPRLTLPSDRPAGTAFVYEPPEGFVALNDPKLAERGSDAKAWVLAAGGEVRSFVPRVNTTHSPKHGGVDERELAQLASTLPETFASDFTWTERRHETRVRPDGARVGLIEGDCLKKTTDILGSPIEQKFRMMQLVFPDDGGTTIATATYGTDEAAKWEPAFEATIARAKGVAIRVPPVPGWVYAAWGSAGVVLGWLGAALVGKAPEAAPASSRAPSKEKDDRPAKTKGNGAVPKHRPDDDEDEEEDADDEDDEDEETADEGHGGKPK